jgi:hypothetical protein
MSPFLTFLQSILRNPEGLAALERAILGRTWLHFSPCNFVGSVHGTERNDHFGAPASHETMYVDLLIHLFCSVYLYVC